MARYVVFLLLIAAARCVSVSVTRGAPAVAPIDRLRVDHDACDFSKVWTLKATATVDDTVVEPEIVNATHAGVFSTKVSSGKSPLAAGESLFVDVFAWSYELNDSYVFVTADLKLATLSVALELSKTYTLAPKNRALFENTESGSVVLESVDVLCSRSPIPLATKLSSNDFVLDRASLSLDYSVPGGAEPTAELKFGKNDVLKTNGLQSAGMLETGVKWASAQAGSDFGNSLAIGDFNGDGYVDVAMGSWLHSVGGAVFVKFGSSLGFAADVADVAADADVVLSGAASYATGNSLSATGDVRGDGFDSLIVGATGYGGSSEGAAYLVFGNQAFSGGDLDSLSNGNDAVRFTGQLAGDFFGISVDGAGDVNADGLDDVVVGAYFNDEGGLSSGSAYVVFGRRSWSAGSYDAATMCDGVGGFRVNGAVNSDQAGYRVAGIGDVNGDGVSDVAVASPRNDAAFPNAGSVSIIFGRETSFPELIDLGSIGALGFTLTGEVGGDELGRSISRGGDVDGDGIDDFLIGAYKNDDSGTLAGKVYVVYGKSSSWASTASVATVSDSLLGGFAGDEFGYDLACAGDVDGDGLSDFLVGSSRSNPLNLQKGSMTVVFGAPKGTNDGLSVDDLLAAQGGGHNAYDLIGETQNDADSAFHAISVAGGGGFLVAGLSQNGVGGAVYVSKGGYRDLPEGVDLVLPVHATPAFSFQTLLAPFDQSLKIAATVDNSESSVDVVLVDYVCDASWLSFDLESGVGGPNITVDARIVGAMFGTVHTSSLSPDFDFARALVEVEFETPFVVSNPPFSATFNASVGFFEDGLLVSEFDPFGARSPLTDQVSIVHDSCTFQSKFRTAIAFAGSETSYLDVQSDSSFLRVSGLGRNASLSDGKFVVFDIEFDSSSLTTSENDQHVVSFRALRLSDDAVLSTVNTTFVLSVERTVPGIQQSLSAKNLVPHTQGALPLGFLPSCGNSAWSTTDSRFSVIRDSPYSATSSGFTLTYDLDDSLSAAAVVGDVFVELIAAPLPLAVVPEVELSLSSSPIAIATGDANGDGFGDVAVALSDGSILVSLGRRPSLSRSFLTFSSGCSNPVSSLLFADTSGGLGFDNLLVGCAGDDQVRLVLGEASFSPESTTTLLYSGSGEFGSSLAAGRVFGSASADLVVGSPGSNEISVFSGGGGETTVLVGPVGSVEFGRSVAVDDSGRHILVGDPEAFSTAGAVHVSSLSGSELQIDATATGSAGGVRLGSRVLYASSEWWMVATNALYRVPLDFVSGSISAVATSETAGGFASVSAGRIFGETEEVLLAISDSVLHVGSLEYSVAASSSVASIDTSGDGFEDVVVATADKLSITFGAPAPARRFDEFSIDLKVAPRPVSLGSVASLSGSVIYPSTKTKTLQIFNADSNGFDIGLKLKSSPNWLEFPTLSPTSFDTVVEFGSSIELVAIIDSSSTIPLSTSEFDVEIEFVYAQAVDDISLESTFDSVLSFEAVLTSALVLTSPETVSLTVDATSGTVSAIIELFSLSTTQTVDWSVVESSLPEWVTLKPGFGSEGTILPASGVSGAFSVEIDASNLNAGIFESTIYVSATSKPQSASFNVTVPVVVEVFRPCQAGEFSSTGNTLKGTCTKCPIDTYNPKTGQTVCLECPETAPTTEAIGSTSKKACSALGGRFSYVDPVTNEPLTDECPDGTDCSLNDFGVTLQTLPLLRGHWRATENTTVVYECRESLLCVGGSDPQKYCLEGHRGIHCQSCDKGLARRGDDLICGVCDADAASADRKRLATALLLIFVVFGSACAFFMHKWAYKVSHEEEEKTQKSREFWMGFLVKVRIVVGHLQVMAAVVYLFPDDFAPALRNFADAMSIVFGNFLALVAVGCSLPNGYNHFVDLLTVTIAPAVLACGILVFWAIASYVSKNEKRDKAIATASLTAFLIVLFTVYPAASATILRTFVCDEFEDGSVVLRVDYSVSCETQRYRDFQAYAAVCTIVFVFGIPFLYAYLLYTSRKVLDPKNEDGTRLDENDALKARVHDSRANKSQFLWALYRPRYFYFELVELLRKLLISSLLVFVFDGLALQVAIELVLMIAFVVFLHETRPYTGLEANRFAIVSAWCGIVVVFLGLMNRLDLQSSDADDGALYSQSALDVISTICVVLPIGIAIIELPLEFSGKCRSSNVSSRQVAV